MDLGLMCLSLCGLNRMLQKMMRKMMTVFVVNYVLTVMKIYRSVAHVYVYVVLPHWRRLCSQRPFSHVGNGCQGLPPQVVAPYTLTPLP